eukprot:9300899-Alexandrium_andersonii.AAC.1
MRFQAPMRGQLRARKVLSPCAKRWRARVRAATERGATRPKQQLEARSAFLPSGKGPPSPADYRILAVSL